MKVTLHQDAEGKKAGESVDVPTSRAKWLITEGYASAGKDVDAATAEDDPRLPENAGNPNKSFAEQVEDGFPAEADPNERAPKPKLDNPDPIERVNVEGDPEKAAKGKDKLADSTPEVDPVPAVPAPASETLADAAKVEVADSK